MSRRVMDRAWETEPMDFRDLDYPEWLEWRDRKLRLQSKYDRAMDNRARYEQRIAWLYKRRPRHHEGARRLKMFAVARKTLLATRRLNGKQARYGDVYTAVNRRGIAVAMWTRINLDHEMHWSPRSGYEIRETDIPF